MQPTMLPAADLPDWFRRYEWDALHAAMGWPPDRYDNGFPWMTSLFHRFDAARQAGCVPSLRLFSEMLLWGGAQQGVIHRFAQGLRRSGGYKERMADVIAHLDAPGRALRAAMGFEGIGLTYGSKLLLFLCPERYGALDGRIRKALSPALPAIYDGNPSSCCKGYLAFLDILADYQDRLAAEGIERPPYGTYTATTRWPAADVETAFFSWASSSNQPSAAVKG